MRSLRTKLTDTYLNTLQTSSDIILLTETWLHPDINNRELFHASYNVYRQDRKHSPGGLSRGGGVLIAVRNTIKSEQVQI